MNRTAKTRLMIVAAAGAVLVAGTGGLYAWRKHKINVHFADLREQGLKAAAAHDYPTAVADLQQYLVRYNDDVEALGVYAGVRPKVVSPDRSHLRETMSALRYYVNLKPDALEQRRELLKLYLTYNLNTEASDLAKRLLETKPNDPELLSALTTAQIRLRQTGEALQTAQRWCEAAPTDAEGQQIRIELLKQQNTDDATIIKDVDALIAAHPDAPGLQVVKAQALLQANRFAEGTKVLRDAAARTDNKPADVRRLASMMDRAGLFDDSAALLVKLAETTPANDEAASETYGLLAHRLWERGDTAAFLKFIEAHPQVLDQEPALLAIQGLILRQTGQKVQGDAAIAKLDAQPQTPIVKAWVALSKAGNEPLTVDRAKTQIDLINDALIDAPNDAYLLHFLGEAYAQTGDRDLAVSIWQRAARTAPAWPIPLMRASNVLAASGQFGEAFSLAEMAAARSQRVALANYIQVWTGAVEAGQRNDGQKLLELIDQALAQLPDQTWLRANRATVLCRLGRVDEAKTSINDMLADEAHPLDQTSLLRLAALSRINKLGLDEAIEGKLRAGFGVNAEAAMTSFLRQSESGGKEAALAAFEKTRNASPDANAREWMVAAAKVRDQANDPGAADAWKAALAKYGDDVNLIQAALGSSSLWQDRPFVDGLIEKLSKLSGERGIAWRLHRARWLIEGSPDEGYDPAATQRASDLLTTLLLSTPNDPIARYWQARCQARFKNYTTAIEHLRVAITILPHDADIRLLKVSLHLQNKDRTAALEEAQAIRPVDLKTRDSRSRLVVMLTQLGAVQEALDIYAKTPQLGTSDADDLQMAILFRAQGESEKVEALISRMMLHPTLMSVAFAADYYAGAGKPEIADQTLQRLYELNLDPGLRELTLAQHWTRRGDLAQATKFAEAATVAAPQNVATWRALVLAHLQAGNAKAAQQALTNAQQAIPQDTYLAQLSAPGVWPLLASAADARSRALAMRLASEPTNAVVRQALELLASRNGSAAPLAPNEPAVEELRRLAEANTDEAPLQIAACEMLMGAGRFSEAATLATRGIQMHPNDDVLPRIAAQAMLGGGQWNQAKSFAQVWRRKAGRDVLAPDLLTAIAALKTGSPAEAESALRPHVQYAMDHLDVHADVVRTFAVALYLQGKGAEAQPLIERAISAQPAFANAWIETAVSSLPVDQAAAWMDRQPPQAGDELDRQLLSLRSWFTLAVRPDATDEVRSKVRGLIETLDARQDLKPDALAQLGLAADQVGDDERAERIYRRILSNGQEEPVIWNNLAMLLLERNRQLDEAETLIGRAVAKMPDATVFIDTQAQVLIANRKLPEARRAIEQALTREPNVAAWKVTAAELAAAEGKPAEAQGLLKAVLDVSDARNSLGEAEVRRAQALRQKLAGNAATN